MATVFKTSTQSGVRWCFDCNTGSKRKRKFFKTKTAAETALQHFNEERRQVGDVWIDMDYVDRIEAVAVLKECRQRGITLRSLLESYKRSPDAVIGRSCAEAVKEFIDAKRTANRRPDYLTQLEYHLGRLILGRESMPVHTVSAADIEVAIAGSGKSAHTRAGVQNKAATFFAWTKRLGYRVDNPCDRLERISVDHAEKRILTPDEGKKLLVTVAKEEPRALAFLALGMIAGLRPDEIGLLRWDAINLDAGTVRIEESKVRGHRRIVTLPDNALEWLRVAKKKRAKLPFDRRIAARIFRTVLQFKKWPQDCLRHSAASYLMAKEKDAAKVADMLGNSPGVLLRVYRELVTDADAKRWFAIAPKAPA